jgi:hypothetical protein
MKYKCSWKLAEDQFCDQDTNVERTDDRERLYQAFCDEHQAKVDQMKARDR